MFFPKILPVIRFLVLATVLCATTACQTATKRERKLDKQAPEALYKQARASLRSYDFQNAIKTYESLEARYPFSDQGRQGRLDLIYAYYRGGESEQAIDAADQFIRENDTHPRVDYAWYLKGLVNFERTPNILERAFNVDLSERTPTTALKSFAAFKTIVEKYPKSDYVQDARQRMIYLRNRLADYEVSVARYYVRRGAYVGAIARAKSAIENYDGAPATREALSLMVASYREMKMNDLAEQTERVYRANFPDEPVKAEIKRPWWKLWI